MNALCYAVRLFWAGEIFLCRMFYSLSEGRVSLLKKSFFPRDRAFFFGLFRMMLVVSLQNVLAYSVNVADNVMLGGYSQAALSGAATVNQIQFLVQQITVSAADAMGMLLSQYWGKGELDPIRSIAGLVLKVGAVFGLLILAVTSFFPAQLLGLFTSDPGIIEAGMEYLSILRFSYIFYILTTILLAFLRSVETVAISFWVSLISLVVNVSVNYTLIFGHFGMPAMGIRGAAIGTVVARVLELGVVLGYVCFREKKLRLFAENPFRASAGYGADYRRVAIPVVTTNLLWSLATPIQTGILGRLSSDAIAANSVSTTMFQYLKVVTVSEASATSVSVGKMVGAGRTSREALKPYVNTLQLLFLLLGIALGGVLLLIREPLLGLYTISPTAKGLAYELLGLMVIIFVGMAYQMPVSVGVIRGGGETRFNLYLNLISTWLIVMPLSFMAAFWWKIPVFWVVFCLNCDQLFKCIPIFFYANSYRWIHVLTRKTTKS